MFNTKEAAVSLFNNSKSNISVEVISQHTQAALDDFCWPDLPKTENFTLKPKETLKVSRQCLKIWGGSTLLVIALKNPKVIVCSKPFFTSKNKNDDYMWDGSRIHSAEKGNYNYSPNHSCSVD